jgi:hypothetical protein
MVPEMENNFDPWHLFAGEELEHVESFDFDIFDTWVLIERPLPA